MVMENMGKKQILRVLKALDGVLRNELKIILCGSASGILTQNLDRRTGDIDILSSIPRLSEIGPELHKIAERYQLSDHWINDASKGFMDFLPDDFKKRLIEIKAGFKRIKVYSISKVDFFIMKLASFRDQDLQDISGIELSKNELKILDRTILEISKFNAKQAHKMQLFIEECGWGRHNEFRR